MITKKLVVIDATITDGSQDLGVFHYEGASISDLRLLKLARKQTDNEFVTLKGIVKQDVTYTMTEEDFIKHGTKKEN